MSQGSNEFVDAENGWPIEPPGVWLEARRRPLELPGPGLLLDRDGVIIRDQGFVAIADDVELLPGVADLIAEANRAGVPVAVVTNQSGIARRRFGWADFVAVEREIARLLAAAGARIDAVVACPFHPEFTENYGAVERYWRKPGPGLVLAAARLLNLEIGASWLVGDRDRDVEAARNAGLAGAVYLSDQRPGRSKTREPPVVTDGFQVLDAVTPLDTLAILRQAGVLRESPTS